MGAKPGPVDPDAPEEFTVTASGLKYRIRRKSEGRKPKASDSVVAHYRGWLDDGKEFSLVPWKPVIEQDSVELGLLRIGHHFLGGVEIGGPPHPPAGPGADRRHQPALGRLVVDQQQATIGIRPHSIPSWSSDGV